MWYATGSPDLGAVYADLTERASAIRALRQRTRHARDQLGADCARLGLEPPNAATDLDTARFPLHQGQRGWLIGVGSDAPERGLFGDMDHPAAEESLAASDAGTLTWTVQVPATPASEPALTEAARIAALLDHLLERASRRGAFGPEHRPAEVAAWSKTEAGRRALAHARAVIAANLRRTPPIVDGPVPAIARGAHLPRRSLAERIRIGSVLHEPRCDGSCDWGGARRILAQTADRTRRLFIAEGHKRIRAGKTRAHYTPATLWIQGDVSLGLFATNQAIFTGRVSRETLSDLSARIEQGFRCPGLGLFLSLLHTVTLDPES